MARGNDIKSFNIYKPTSKTTGGAAQLNYSPKYKCLFLDIANQVRDRDDKRPYDWDNKIVVKIGLNDIYQFLEVLTGVKKQVMMYHSTPGEKNKSKQIQIKRQSNGFYMTVTRKEGNNKVRAAVPIGIGESIALKALLKEAVVRIHGW